MKLLLALLSLLFINTGFQDNSDLNGAWEVKQGNNTTVLLVKDGYLTITSFTNDAFKETRGGFYSVSDKQLRIQQEFNTTEKNLKEESLHFSLEKNSLTIGNLKFRRVDDGKAGLAGVWRITGRMEDGKINQIHQTGTRKTLKLLTGTRFQWFAIDPNGNKFSGTGGGTYSFANGEYVENIEFFSRDASRIGASLVFKDHLEGAKWHHTGLSSKGANIYEIWENAFLAD